MVDFADCAFTAFLVTALPLILGVVLGELLDVPVITSRTIKARIDVNDLCRGAKTLLKFDPDHSFGDKNAAQNKIASNSAAFVDRVWP
jgi:hypothetical protein